MGLKWNTRILDWGHPKVQDIVSLLRNIVDLLKQIKTSRVTHFYSSLWGLQEMDKETGQRSVDTYWKWSVHKVIHYSIIYIEKYCKQPKGPSLGTT